MGKPTLLLFFLFFCAVIGAQEGNNFHVSSQMLNFREALSTSAEVIQKLKKYDNVVVLNASACAYFVGVHYSVAC